MGVRGFWKSGWKPFVVAAVICLATILSHQARTAVGLDALLADDSSTIHAILGQQSDAWNRGDLETFMQAYWNSPELTFSAGGATTRGWQATLDRYRKRYPTREIMGTLTFSELETQVLGADAALTLGRWHLERNEVADGNFTLVWKRIGQDWRIIHDHSSSTPTTKP